MFVSIGLVAQSTPIMGYDLVTWGASVASVRRIYNIEQNIPVQVSASDPNISLLRHEIISNTISHRIFWFHNDELYSVTVVYKDSSSMLLNLQSAIKNNFGIATDYKKNGFDERFIFGKYSPELIVTIHHVSNINYLAVMYTWEKFINEYRASKVEL